MTKQPALWITELVDNNRRKAKPRQCRCGNWILTGLDDDHCATTARADLTALTYPGELAAAYTQGRGTYDLTAGQLWRRHPWQHTHPSTHPVLPEHRCNDPVPADWTQPLPTRPPPPDHPQF